MVPLVRIPELIRTHVQVLLDGGVHILNLPDVRSPQQAAEFVKLGKYPPLGHRGISSSSANFDYRLNDSRKDPLASNAATRLMVMIESDEGYSALDEILAVEGIDMLTVGPADWAQNSNIHGTDIQAQLSPKIDRVVRSAVLAGKIVALTAGNDNEVRHWKNMGARVIFLGVDVNLKRNLFADRIRQVHDALR